MIEFASKVLSAQLNKTHLFFVGQAGFILKSEKGTLFAVDLYLSHNVERTEKSMGFKRLVQMILSPGELTFDYLFATHSHFDHFDPDSLPILMSNSHTKLFASESCKIQVSRLQMNEKNISYVHVGDKVNADDILIECVPCDHGIEAPDAVGLIVTIDRKKIYITGDTCFRQDYAAEIAQKGPFDLLIAPINGAYGNLDERQCISLAKIIKPKMMIPCHYGMFALHGGNPGLFMETIEKELPNQNYLLMTPGEELII